MSEKVKRGLCPYCKMDAGSGPYAHASREDCIAAVRSMHLAYCRRIGQFVLNRLEEVKNDIGGVIGYKLVLDVDETEQLCKELEAQ